MKTPTCLFAPIALTSVLIGANIAHAQTYTPSKRIPVADNTLGTQVAGNGNFSITGGLQKGQTLFHSFSDFSVPTNGQATFFNPSGNRDIITRVTGGLFSDINGTVSTQGANFFLINPNGLVFGPNAQLNVGKAFVGSTANSIDLVDGGGRTITFGANPNGDAPLLSVNPNVFFNVSRLNMGGGNGSISNFGTLQTPNNSQYISLIGGNVTLDGSQGGGKIIAPGGRVDIGGLKSDGTITVGNNGMVFGGSGIRSDVSMINGAGIIVRATGTLDTVNTFFSNMTAPGSSINISTNHLDILKSGAKLSDQTAAIDAGLELNSGVQTKAAGGINIDATGKVSLNNSAIKNTLRSGAEGNIGGIKILAGTLDVNNNSIVSTVAAGKGNAGNIDLKVVGDINLTNKGQILSAILLTALGNAGDINIKAAGDILISGSESGINSSTLGQGDAGKITIDTQGKLFLVNSGVISSSIAQTGIGNSKGISISARELELANRGFIGTDTLNKDRVDDKSNAGDINIITTGDIKIAGYDPSSANFNASDISFVSSGTAGSGDAGKITIDTQGKLFLVNGGFISSSIAQTGIGNSKGISISAREVELANGSLIGTFTLTSSKGNGGDINIKTIGDIKIAGYNSSSTNPSSSDTSQISSSSSGQGDTGKITIDTQGKLSVVNGGSISSSIGETGIGNSKGILISARELELANLSRIYTDTDQNTLVNGKGNAGDIDIKTTGDINISGYNSLSTNSNNAGIAWISSSSLGKGDAGKITIDTQGKLFLVNGGFISSSIAQTGIGNSKGISISARELELANTSYIETITSQSARVDGKGNSGDINIKTTGDIKISGSNSSSTKPTSSEPSQISSSSLGQGDAGKITVDTQGKLSLVNGGVLSSQIADNAVGNSQGISVSARELELKNGSNFTTSTRQTGKSPRGGQSNRFEPEQS
jgi:filamentous hemagglutinin family protein